MIYRTPWRKYFLHAFVLMPFISCRTPKFSDIMSAEMENQKGEQMKELEIFNHCEDLLRLAGYYPQWATED